MEKISWTGRIRRGGTFTNQSRRQLAGRTHRSDIPIAVRFDELEKMVVKPTGSSEDNASHPKYKQTNL